MADPLVPRFEGRGGSGPMHYSLVDYVVLEFIGGWEVVARETSDAAAQWLALLLVAGELAREGYPLELALEFKDYTAHPTSFVASAALQGSLMALRSRRLVLPRGRGAQTVRLTSDGHGVLKVLRTRMTIVDATFQRLPPAYFLVTDLMKANIAPRPKRGLRSVITDMAATLASRSPEELRILLINLGASLAHSGSTPRSYRFDRIYVRGRSEATSSPTSAQVRNRPAAKSFAHQG